MQYLYSTLPHSIPTQSATPSVLSDHPSPDQPNYMYLPGVGLNAVRVLHLALAQLVDLLRPVLLLQDHVLVLNLGGCSNPRAHKREHTSVSKHQ